jgi:hypothetical protein
VSIQDDVKYVKKELSGDEKVLESAFKIEALYKKYKFVVWGVAGAILLFFIVQTAMQSINQAKLEDANNALLTLQENPKDNVALETLKQKNPKLFELYSYSVASAAQDSKALKELSNSKNSIIADASKYTISAIEKKPTDSKLFKELALFEEGYLAMKSGDIENAKAKLELIDDRSSLAMLTKLLKHSMIKVK